MPILLWKLQHHEIIYIFENSNDIEIFDQENGYKNSILMTLITLKNEDVSLYVPSNFQFQKGKGI